MLNSRPNNKNYHQGNYIPKNKDKIIKLNTQGGVYYRSSWELKIMTWLDMNNKVTKWGSESLRIPYQMTHFENGDSKIKEHSYYPDFFYEMRIGGVLKQVVVEVKPDQEYKDALLFTEGKFNIPDGLTLKKLKNLEYKFKMAQRNSEKWKTMINWCTLKGYEFIIITEQHLSKFNL